MVDGEGNTTKSAEHIPSQDRVSRLTLDITGIAPESLFPFRFDPKTGLRAESVFWRKYAPDIADIHRRGCVWQMNKNTAHAEKGRPHVEYIGARTSQVASVRGIKGEGGHTLGVVHCEEHGDIAHAEIRVEPASGMPAKKLKNQLVELRHHLVLAFGDLEPHKCDQSDLSVDDVIAT